MSERIDNFKQLIERSESCRATHLTSSVERERFIGEREAFWEGMVETFQLHDHPKGIKRAYAWDWNDGEKPEPRYKVVLGVPPVNSPEDAVKVKIGAAYKKILSEL